jgi:hypothetical protein
VVISLNHTNEGSLLLEALRSFFVVVGPAPCLAAGQVLARLA